MIMYGIVSTDSGCLHSHFVLFRSPFVALEFAILLSLSPSDYSIRAFNCEEVEF